MKAKYSEYYSMILSTINHWIQIRIAQRELKENLIEIDGDSLYKLLKAEYPNAKIYLADEYYKIPKLKNFLFWLSVDSLNKKTWKKDSHDCDEFALFSVCRIKRIIGNCSYGFAYCSDPSHAFNILINRIKSELKINQIEPQNDTISDYPKDKVYLIIM